MNYSIRHSYSLKPLTQSQGVCPTLWFAIEMNDRATGVGVRGYSNGPEYSSFPILGKPEATVEVPKNCFFALGDNSYHSSDSRDWGPVPQANVVGRGWLVYWPFSKHWGPVQ